MPKRIRTGLIILALFCSMSSCRKYETGEVGAEPISSQWPQVVSLSFDIFNHTQGFLKSMIRPAKPGQSFVMKIEDLGVTGVDERRIVIREGKLGMRVAYSRLGECEFAVPNENRSYTVYLMNASSNADYRAVDVRVGLYEGNLCFPRAIYWVTEDRDGLQGPDEPLIQAIQQLNDALDYPWVSYGRFFKVDTVIDSHLRVGYGECRDQYGWHTYNWAGVNPIHCSSHRFRLETFLEEIFELVTGTENIGGKDTASLITDGKTGRLNRVGQDLFAYIFVKDIKVDNRIEK